MWDAAAWNQDCDCISFFSLSSPPIWLFIALYVSVSPCQCVGEEIWVDSRTVYIGHKEPPPGAEAYIPQRYPDNRIVSSKVSQPRLFKNDFIWLSFHISNHGVCVLLLIRMPLCPTVHLLELHPQESFRAVQADRQLLLPGHFSGPGEVLNTAVELWLKIKKNLAAARSFKHKTQRATSRNLTRTSLGSVFVLYSVISEVA